MGIASSWILPFDGVYHTAQLLTQSFHLRNCLKMMESQKETTDLSDFHMYIIYYVGIMYITNYVGV